MKSCEHVQMLKLQWWSSPGAVLRCGRGARDPRFTRYPQIQKLAVDLKCCQFDRFQMYAYMEFVFFSVSQKG